METIERFRAFAANYFNGKKITAHTIERFRTYLGEKMKPVSVKRYLAGARGWLAEQRVFRKHKVSAEEVMLLLKTPRCPKGKEPKALTPEQVAKLLEAATASPDRDLARFVLLGLTVGGRVGEVATIKGEDFDASEGILNVYAPKTMTHRKVPLRWSSTLKAIAAKGLTGPLMDLDGRVRTYRWEALCKAAGIGDVEPRALRRTVASIVAASGRVTTAAYVAWLGHAPTTGIEFYQDASVDRPAGGCIEEWLGCADPFSGLLARCF
jgi:integrase